MESTLSGAYTTTIKSREERKKRKRKKETKPPPSKSLSETIGNPRTGCQLILPPTRPTATTDMPKSSTHLHQLQH